MCRTYIKYWQYQVEDKKNDNLVLKAFYYLQDFHFRLTWVDCKDVMEISVIFLNSISVILIISMAQTQLINLCWFYLHFFIFSDAIFKQIGKFCQSRPELVSVANINSGNSCSSSVSHLDLIPIYILQLKDSFVWSSVNLFVRIYDKNDRHLVIECSWLRLSWYLYLLIVVPIIICHLKRKYNLKCFQ